MGKVKFGPYLLQIPTLNLVSSVDIFNYITAFQSGNVRRVPEALKKLGMLYKRGWYANNSTYISIQNFSHMMKLLAHFYCSFTIYF